jgi:hypothetical protein
MDLEELKKELARQRRANYIQSWIILGLFLVFCAFGSYQLRYLREQVHIAVSAAQVRPINGTRGAAGADGVNGINGQNGQGGQSGQNATSDQIAAAVSQYLADNPPAQGPQGAAGADGTNGKDGKTLQVQITAGCQLQQKYSTDSFWDTIAQLPLPCVSLGTP